MVMDIYALYTLISMIIALFVWLLDETIYHIAAFVYENALVVLCECVHGFQAAQIPYQD